MICNDSLRTRPAIRRKPPAQSRSAVMTSSRAVVFLHQGNEGIFQRRLGTMLGSGTTLQIIRRSLGNDLALVNQPDAVAILGLVQKVGRYHHRDSPLDHGVDV